MIIDISLKLLVTYDLDYVIYGHAGNGNLHLRPIVDFNSKDWNT
jgi:FAD/FMN-containing dehydrogenase